jgi:RNA polymerase sigma factor (sigma-70 family)
VSAKGPGEQALRQIDQLFNGGTLAGKSDVQLLKRFAEARDEDAFAAIVARHGPMVLSVCHRVARSLHDAEDAFQATFLVLAKKAHARWSGDSIGGWLHRVAHRAALRAHLESKRRTAREQSVAVSDRISKPNVTDWAEVLPALHEEIDRLPERLRTPIVLCELEALTRDEAAQRLGWPAGTVASRLSRGRQLLRNRLVRRGVLGAAGAPALLFACKASGTVVPPALANAAVLVACCSRAERGIIDANVLEVAEGLLKAMARSKIRRAAIGTVSIGAVLVLAALAFAARQENRQVVFTGTVVDSAGGPVEGAEIVATFRDRREGMNEVVAETRSDAQGRYRLTVPVFNGDPRRFWASAVWAHVPGRLVASRELGPLVDSADVPVQFVIGPPAQTAFEVRAPDGSPVAGAKIAPAVVYRGALAVPKKLGSRISESVVTNAGGEATMSAFLPEEISTVFVRAPGLGTQQFAFDRGGIPPRVRVLELLPVGRLRGRLVGAPDVVGEVKLSVVAWNQSRRPLASGIFDVTTTKDGRFEIDEFPVGNARVRGFAGADSRWYVQAGKEATVTAGKTSEFEITLARSVVVTGVVREKGTLRPIEGVRLTRIGAREVLTTNANGAYRGHAQPGAFSLDVESTPSGYATPMYGPHSLNIPEDARDFAVPPIELTPAASVQGLVVDEQGKPMAGATVSASWPVNEGPNLSGPQEASVRSDGEGLFRFVGVPTDANVQLRAQHGILRTSADVATRAGAKDQARLRVDNTQSAALSGKVTDEAGNPVAGAQVHFRTVKRLPSGQMKGEDLVDFDGVYVITTDKNGLFATPRMLDREAEYIAFAAADGFIPARSATTPGSASEFKELRLNMSEPRAAITGRVLDRQGRPIEGAEAWLSSEIDRRLPATSDAEGHVRWDRAARNPTFLFVRKAGFRFHGQVVIVSGKTIDIVLTRENEEPASRLVTLSPLLAHAAAIDLARRALEPLRANALKEVNDAPQRQFLTVLAEVDPAQALAIISAQAANSPGKAFTLQKIALVLAEKSTDEAMAVIETIPDPFHKALAYLALLKVFPADDRTGRRTALVRALPLARQCTDPGERVHLLGRVGEGYLDLGEVELATTILREGEVIAHELPTTARDGYSRASFAEELAQIDLPAAMKLVDGVGKDVRNYGDRHQLNIIQEVASRDPVAAENLFNELKPSFSVNRALPRICHAMALKDPERAQKLLSKAADNTIDPYAKPYALGMMALAVEKRDRALAARLLREAYTQLASLAPSHPNALPGQTACTIAASLLPIVEVVQADRVTECFWTAVSLRDATPRRAITTTPVQGDLTLALFLARYDREVARSLFEPIANRLESLKNQITNARAFAYAGAEIDPLATLARIQSLPDSSDQRPARREFSKDEALRAFAAWLSKQGEARWNEAKSGVLNLWVVGGEDLY